jgi:hypothetical protein
MQNMHQIGMALHAYHNTFQSFPPAYVADAEGKPMHSWRVLVLPFLGDDRLRRAYEQYDFREPWTGPNNLQVASVIDAAAISPFHCPSSGNDHETNYVAVVGRETAWPEANSVAILGIADQPAETIMLVEVTDAGVHWMEPKDLTFDQALQGINTKATKVGIASKHPGGVCTLFSDGHMQFLPDETPPDVLRALLTRAGNEALSVPHN